MAVVLAVVVTKDIDGSVALEDRAVGLFCQVDHWDLLIKAQAQVQFLVQLHQFLALEVVVIVFMVLLALLPMSPQVPLLLMLSAWGCWRGGRSALIHHLNELIVLIHAASVV